MPMVWIPNPNLTIFLKNHFSFNTNSIQKQSTFPLQSEETRTQRVWFRQWGQHLQLKLAAVEKQREDKYSFYPKSLENKKNTKNIRALVTLVNSSRLCILMTPLEKLASCLVWTRGRFNMSCFKWVNLNLTRQYFDFKGHRRRTSMK